LKRFEQTKLFIVGHTWGSIIGMNLVAKRPELILTYIGIGQVVDMERGEELSYQFTLTEAQRLENKSAIRELHKIGNPPYKKLSDAGVQRKWLAKFHGSSLKGSGVGTLLKNFSFRDTRPIDLVKFVQGAIFSLTSLEEEQLHIDFLSNLVRIDVPVIFCCGRRDYNTPFELVSEYVEKLDAPKKELVWFDQSAHLPNFEEPEKFCNLCISLLRKE
jgi:pimeloyl-ACP methyl ester carboxylesterase